MQRLLVTLALSICGCTPTVNPPVITEPVPPAADSAPTSVPAESADDPLLGFTYRGRPIHPLAVTGMIPWEGGPRGVDLDTQPLVDDAVEIDGARVSFDDDEPGWDVYYVHDRVGSRFLISVAQSGGGSGIFSTVIVAEIRDNQLVPTLVTGEGDRCNGGLAGDPRFDGDAVLVPRSLTPYDLVALSTRDVSHIEPYADLESSAASCMGYALVRVEPGRDAELVSVTLDRDWYGDQPDWTEGYPLQARFNRIHAQRIAAGQTELDPAAIDRFVDELLASK